MKVFYVRAIDKLGSGILIKSRGSNVQFKVVFNGCFETYMLGCVFCTAFAHRSSFMFPCSKLTDFPLLINKSTAYSCRLHFYHLT